jgi:transglutaminase/protease-like cytokinesis protein 3
MPIEKGYILEEPIVQGFDFSSEDGESTWPEIPEKKTFLIGECGAKIELDNEPLLLASSSNFTSPLKKVDKAKVNKSLSYLPKRESTSETDMCTAMKKAQTKYSLNQAESAYFVFRWITENIAYDCYSYVHGGIDYKEESSYTKGLAVCEAYSLIFKRMCEALGLEAVKISGYSKGTSYVPGKLPTKTNHAWNAVKIDGTYYLLDATWGAGSCNKDTFEPNFKDSYFCTDPNIFI